MQAFYHSAHADPKEFTVLKKHQDGLVDIGPKGGPAVVTRCLVSPSDKPEPGTVTLIDESSADKTESAPTVPPKK